MDLSLIGPDRRERTGLGRVSVTLADMIGFALGAVVAIALLLLLTG
jgi:hypothetical protein